MKPLLVLIAILALLVLTVGSAAAFEPNGPVVVPDGPDFEPNGPMVVPDAPDFEPNGPMVVLRNPHKAALIYLSLR